MCLTLSPLVSLMYQTKCIHPRVNNSPILGPKFMVVCYSVVWYCMLGHGVVLAGNVGPGSTQSVLNPTHASPPEPPTPDSEAGTSGADNRSDADAASPQEQPVRQADATTSAAPDASALQGYLNPTQHYRQCCHSSSHEEYSSRCHCLLGMALVILPVTTLAALYLIYHGTNV